MTPVKLELENFWSFKSASLDLDGIGFTQVSGWNDDDKSASGAGKTGLFDAIPFILFGRTPRNVKMSEFIFDGAKKSCIAKLTLRLNSGQELKVVRSRKPDDFYYIVDDGKELRGTNVKETQQIIENILKIDFNTFINSVYFSRSSSSRFIAASNVEKIDILTRVLDLSEFDSAYDLAREKEKSYQGILDKLLINKKNIEQRSFDANKEAVELIKQRDSFQDDITQQIEALKDKAKSKATLIDNIKAEIDELKSRKYGVREKSSVSEPDLRVYDNKISELKKVDTYVELGKLDAEEEEIDKKLVIIPKLTEGIKDVQSKINTIEYDIENFKKGIKHIESVGSGECKHCLQIIDGNLLEQQKTDTMCDIEVLGSKLVPLFEKRKKLDAAFDKCESLENRLKDIQKERRALQSKQIDIVNLINEQEKQKERAIRQYEKEIQAIENESKEIETRKMVAQQTIESKEDKVVEIKSDIRQLAGEVGALKKKSNPFIKLSLEKSEEAAKLSDELQILVKEEGKINNHIESLSILKSSYKNIKYYVFEQTIDELNRRIDKYMDPLFGEDIIIKFLYESGKSSAKLKLNTKILKNGKEKSFESLSDGEKARANLACSFAMSDIVANRKGTSMSLLLLDEVFDGMPAECRERVIELLETLKQERDVILMIDHFYDAKHLVDNEVHVEKKNGISTIQ